jgi:Lhr-like helicase
MNALKNGMPKEDFLFSVGIFKAFMSSPKAAWESIQRRIEKVDTSKAKNEFASENLVVLNELKLKLEAILSTHSDTKYKKLKDTLLELGWTGIKKNDRYVIFAERINTLEYLKYNLQHDFNIAEESIEFFHGGLSDTDQQAIIEDFGKKIAPFVYCFVQMLVRKV